MYKRQILGRAEMFASKNGILDSALDGIGMGIGFTITLTIMGTIREILGSGTWMAGLDGLLPFLPEGFKIQVIPTSCLLYTSTARQAPRAPTEDGASHDEEKYKGFHGGDTPAAAILPASAGASGEGRDPDLLQRPGEVHGADRIPDPVSYTHLDVYKRQAFPPL